MAADAHPDGAMPAAIMAVTIAPDRRVEGCVAAGNNSAISVEQTLVEVR